VSKDKIGAAFEQDVRDVLEGFSLKFPLTYVRLYDTKSARGKFLPEQPGDYIVASPNGGHLLECKASEEHSSLRSCLAANVSTQQAAAHRLWERTGQPCWFLFNSVRSFELELWKGGVVGRCRAKGLMLPKPGQPNSALTVSRDTLEDLLYNTLGLRTKR
jgi:hypothetical protein